jgi:hypothetical protein
MTVGQWHNELQPPAGGLMRLQQEIGRRRARSDATRRAIPFAMSSITLMAALVFAIVDYARKAPERNFERALKSELATLETRPAIVQSGIERDLPSGRTDVRIAVLARRP